MKYHGPNRARRRQQPDPRSREIAEKHLERCRRILRPGDEQRPRAPAKDYEPGQDDDTEA